MATQCPSAYTACPAETHGGTVLEKGIRAHQNCTMSKGVNGEEAQVKLPAREPCTNQLASISAPKNLSESVTACLFSYSPEGYSR